MKILFIIQGEGRGHLTQALSLRQKLTDEGHQVVGVLVGKSPARRLPDFFSKKIEAPVYPFESPNFLPSAQNKQVNLVKSVAYNVFPVAQIYVEYPVYQPDDKGDRSRCGHKLL